MRYAPYAIDAMEAVVMASMPHASPVSCCDSTLNSSEEGIVSRLYIMNAIISEKKPTKRTANIHSQLLCCLCIESMVSLTGQKRLHLSGPVCFLSPLLPLPSQ